ncbi:sodium-coupled monocarboxylate transporter 1-like [Aphidius gifuensis]|nr:sodium-coupled monocarboxylate transporter 1-like [Aphidius gifuensis]
MKQQYILIIFIIGISLSSAELSKTNEQQKQCNDNNPVIINFFSWIDYTVLSIMLIVSCLIGTFYGFLSSKQETNNDFLLGGSHMGTIPMAMSLAASFITAIELLGNPAEMYGQGTQFWMTCLSFIIVVPITSKYYLPVYMKLRLTSSYEYLNLRFHKHCRLLASLLYMIQMVLYTSVAVYAPALALSHVTGLDTYIAVTLVYVVCIFYASQGGMKAVIMTDTFQAIILMLSLFIIVLLGINDIGDFMDIWNNSKNTNRIEFFNIDPNLTVRHSFWSVVIGGSFYWATMFCSNQSSIQKYLSVQNSSQVKKALWVSAISLIIIYTVNFITGMILYTVYKDCDPQKAGYITKSDQLLPLYVINIMGKYPGIPGLFVAGIFAASLGTVASALNSLAAITCEDIFQGLFNIKIPSNKAVLYARLISIFFGILSFLFVFIVERLGSVMQVALSFNGMVGGVTLGMFTLGMFIPWANGKGAIIGSITALIIVLWIGIGAQVENFYDEINLDSKITSIDHCPCINETTAILLSINTQETTIWTSTISKIYKISYLWYSMIGCMITVIVGTAVSLLTGPQNPADLDSDLLSPPIKRFIDSLATKSSSSNVKGITNLSLELEDDKIKCNVIKSSIK